MTQSFVLLIYAFRGLRTSLLKTKHLAEFTQADLCPTSAPQIFFSLCFPKSGCLCRITQLISSGTENFWPLPLKFRLLGGTLRSHCHRRKTPTVGMEDCCYGMGGVMPSFPLPRIRHADGWLCISLKIGREYGLLSRSSKTTPSMSVNKKLEESRRPVIRWSPGRMTLIDREYRT